jgi:hypothetical protein
VTAARVAALLEELARQRFAFVAAVRELGTSATDMPIIGDWDGRDLVVHVAFWSDHGADALELAQAGRGDAFDYDPSRTDAMNAAAAAAGHALALDAALQREATAYDRLRSALAAIDDELLDTQLGNGDAVEDVVRYDGPDHYAEHAAHAGMPHE